MNSKKAQAAMEFLMTYGWAILVVLIVVGALAYFGVLNPNNLIPEKCVFPTQLTCSDWKVTPNAAAGTVQMVLTNGGGKDMIISTLNVTGISITNTSNTCAYQSTIAPFPFSIKGGETKTILIANCNIDATKAASKTKYAFWFNYTFRDSTFPHSMAGELFARAD